MTVKSYTMLLSFLLLFSVVQPKLPNNLQRSSEIRDHKIDALWYKDRGIRPVGRFGRRIVKTTRGVYYGKQSICSSCRYPDTINRRTVFIM